MPKSSELVHVVAIWIDWYAYHVARFRGLQSEPRLAGRVAGIELVGGIGVHAGLKFREELPADLPVTTLVPGESWTATGKLKLSILLWNKLSQHQPAILLVPGYYTLPGIAAALWAKVHGSASVLMTESTAADHARSKWKERAKSAGLKLLFDYAVVGGMAHRAYLQELGFPADRVEGFYDVVANDFFIKGCSAWRGHRNAKPRDLPTAEYFLYVGRFAPEKNIQGLLQSWLRYRDEGGSWKLVLVGDGPEALCIRETISRSRYAQDVVLPGLIPTSGLLPFYAFATCFVLPSHREPWGLVVNEAMASGLPVLVSIACGCALDLVDEGRNGFTFSSGDSVGLTTLLHRMEALDAPSRKAFGSHSLEVIAHYTPANFGRSVASLLRRVITTDALVSAEGGAQ